MTNPSDLRLPSEEARDRGMEKAVGHAQSVCLYWDIWAMDYLKKYIDQVTGPFMTEDFRNWAEAKGLQSPPSKRAYGSIIQKASKNGLIQFHRYGKTTNPKAHCTPAAIWVKL